MADITYCVNLQCPFTDCERHLVHVDKTNVMISVANFDGVCKKYISHLIDEVEQEIKK